MPNKNRVYFYLTTDSWLKHYFHGFTFNEFHVTHDLLSFIDISYSGCSNRQLCPALIKFPTELEHIQKHSRYYTASSAAWDVPQITSMHRKSFHIPASSHFPSQEAGENATVVHVTDA